MVHNNSFNDFKKSTCSIVGARGYAGLELARLLLAHPQASLTHCFATSAFDLSAHLSNPKATQVQCLPDTEIMANLTDYVFLATPAEVSLKLAPQIIASGKIVIDLSGAFRLKKNDYQKWYGFEHTQKNTLLDATYGLIPWVGPSRSERMIANPGCYATSILLALLPLIKDNLILLDSIVIDAKSGSTGAGKKATEGQLFAEVDGECLPYKVGQHQHLPEILETIETLTGVKLTPHMTTSLLPVRRGIISGIYAKLNAKKSVEDVIQSYKKYYADYSLVRHGLVSEKPEGLLLKRVVGTAKTHISYSTQEQNLYVFSCIDNLLKGAASQAVENFNRLLDQSIDTGLNQLEAMT